MYSMKVTFYELTTNLPVSALIRWGLEEPSSHFAFSVHGLVVSQDFSGLSVSHENDYFENKQIIHEKTRYIGSKDLDKILARIFSDLDGCKYDFDGFGYFALRAALKKFCNVPFPKDNQWDKEDKALCTGIAGYFYEVVPEIFSMDVKDFDMISPHQLLKLIL